MSYGLRLLLTKDSKPGLRDRAFLSTSLSNGALLAAAAGRPTLPTSPPTARPAGARRVLTLVYLKDRHAISVELHLAAVSSVRPAADFRRLCLAPGDNPPPPSSCRLLVETMGPAALNVAAASLHRPDLAGARVGADLSSEVERMLRPLADDVLQGEDSARMTSCRLGTRPRGEGGGGYRNSRPHARC